MRCGLLPVGMLSAVRCAMCWVLQITVNCAKLIEELVHKYLDNSCIRVQNGAVAETTALLNEKWDHIMCDTDSLPQPICQSVRSRISSRVCVRARTHARAYSMVGCSTSDGCAMCTYMQHQLAAVGCCEGNMVGCVATWCAVLRHGARSCNCVLVQVHRQWLGGADRCQGRRSAPDTDHARARRQIARLHRQARTRCAARNTHGGRHRAARNAQPRRRAVQCSPQAVTTRDAPGGQRTSRKASAPQSALQDRGCLGWLGLGRTANIALAAERVSAGKWLNAGQAPHSRFRPFPLTYIPT